MGDLDRLLAVWADAEGRRHVVGELARDARGYFFFGYRLDSLPDAEAHGFRLLPEFPQRRGPNDPYRSSSLFATFKQRIPSSSRPDYVSTLEAWGVTSEDPFEILLRSGGVQMTDRLELAEFREPGDELLRPLSFRLSGGRWTKPAVTVEPGADLRLQREPDNPKDPFATLVTTPSGEPIGWVPKQYSEWIAGLLDSGHKLYAQAERELLLPESRGRWVVRLASMKGAAGGGYQIPSAAASLGTPLAGEERAPKHDTE